MARREAMGAFEVDYGEENPKPMDKDVAESLEWVKPYFKFKDFRGEFKDYREGLEVFAMNLLG